MDIQLIGLIHRIVVSVFLFFFLFKTILLIANIEKLLNTLREKTKIVDIILGVIILITGTYIMIVTKNHSMWMNIKVLIALSSIPLGIISMKKANKVLSIITVMLILAAYGLGEMKLWNRTNNETEIKTTEETLSESSESEVQIIDSTSNSILEQNNSASAERNKEIYVALCLNCHGIDGKLGKFNASDLSKTILTIEQKMEIISNGKGLMKGYKEELSQEEIKSLAIYLYSFK